MEDEIGVSQDQIYLRDEVPRSQVMTANPNSP